MSSSYELETAFPVQGSPEWATKNGGVGGLRAASQSRGGGVDKEQT